MNIHVSDLFFLKIFSSFSFFLVENYLEEVQLHNVLNAQGVNAIPAGAHVRDDEQVTHVIQSD